MRPNWPSVAISYLCLCLSPLPLGAIVLEESTFDADLEGWILVDANGAPAEGDLSWNATGGDPGGFAFFSDLGSDGGFMRAPSRFLGDWTELDGNGSVTYDHRILTADGIPVPYEVRIEGTGSEAHFFGDTPIGPNDWSHVSVPMTAGEWIIVSGIWSDILSNVSELRVRIEQINGDDTDGIDNIRLEQTEVSVQEHERTDDPLVLISAPNPTRRRNTLSYVLPASAGST